MAMGVAWMERHQVLLYVGGLALGALIGLAMPAIAQPAELVILPVLALLLYATFLGIPLTKLGRAFRDWRFLGTVLVLNFLVVPVVVWLVSRIVAFNEVLLVGVLFVLLTPCIDYVIVFAGLAGGDEKRLLAAAPLLMLVQMLALPLYLWMFVGAEFIQAVEFAPFIEAFIFIIVLPLVAAALTQVAAARSRAARAWQQVWISAMVPLMVATLAVVVASQIAGVGTELAALLGTIPVYILFAAVMVPLGMLLSRMSRLDLAGRRAVVFSGATRNSLVVLPLVIALPDAFEMVPLVVVTQTLVELVIMVVFVWLIPKIMTDSTEARRRGEIYRSWTERERNLP